MNSEVLYQLYEPVSSTYTYLLFDEHTMDGILIDPVLETSDRDLKLLSELGINLLYILETHIHADHITGASRIAKMTGAQIGVSSHAKVTGKHLPLNEGDILIFGHRKIMVLETPGHTNTCLSYLTNGRVFTGDTLLVRGCGRTDFQEGSAEKLFTSVREKLYRLPDQTKVYPGHDYKGFTSSSIGEEKSFNSRISNSRSLEEFVQIMSNLNLPYPKRIDEAVPANLALGEQFNKDKL